MAPPLLKTIAAKQARRLRRKLNRKLQTQSSELPTLVHSGPACLQQSDPRWRRDWMV